MAKATKQYDEENERGSRDRDTPIAATRPLITDDDEQRLEDERKDRERFAQMRRQPLSPEEASDLKRELVVLKDEHEGEVNRLRAEYRQKKQEINEKLSAGVAEPEVPSTGLLSNETDESGARKYSAPKV